MFLCYTYFCWLPHLVVSLPPCNLLRWTCIQGLSLIMSMSCVLNLGCPPTLNMYWNEKVLVTNHLAYYFDMIWYGLHNVLGLRVHIQNCCDFFLHIWNVLIIQKTLIVPTNVSAHNCIALRMYNHSDLYLASYGYVWSNVPNFTLRTWELYCYLTYWDTYYPSFRTFWPHVEELYYLIFNMLQQCFRTHSAPSPHDRFVGSLRLNRTVT
jgi:hypothetical protein